MEVNAFTNQLSRSQRKSLESAISKPVLTLLNLWFNEHDIRIICSKSRLSKLGDYRSPKKGEAHRITINNDLNPYSFLITLIHEFAHLKTWVKYKHKVQPHGEEWKTEYKSLFNILNPFSIFPNEIQKELKDYMTDPKASTCCNHQLVRALKKYDAPNSSFVTIEQLTKGQFFSTKNGRKFKNLGVVRKRYRCVELNSNKTYLFNPVAEVVVV
jgi:hypothetical protein